MAYITATVVEKRIGDRDGSIKLVVQFTGDRGESPVLNYLSIVGSTSLVEVRKWAIDIVTRLNARGTVADNLAIGATLDLTPIS